MLKQDVAKVAEIEKEDPSPWNELHIRSTYRSRHTSSWVVEDKLGVVVGYAIITTDWMIASVLRLRVAKARRNKGAGKALLEMVVNATGDDCSVEVAVDEGESAGQVLLSRFGFSCVNKTDTGYLFRRGTRFMFAPDLRYRLTHHG
jgi:ribosomal protein S18 acetylase RimI-like enzyme